GVPGPAGRMSRLPGVGDDSPVTQKTPPCPGGVLGPDGAYRSGADGLGHLPAGLVGALLRTTPRLVRGLAEVAAVHVRGPGRGHVAGVLGPGAGEPRSEEHTSELQSRFDLVCRPLLEKKTH